MADEAYFKQHGLEAKLTELINEVAAAKPADPLRYLSEKLGAGGGSGIEGAVCAPALDAPAPPNAPGAEGLVCPCNLFGDLSYGEPIISKKEKTEHPPWYPSQAGEDLGLRVHNTLTDQSDLMPFVPGRGRRVLWYTCGPTVYDACHMGHARAYLTFDILRRIIEDYFRYEVLYQINITDIDDKIILRARRNKLLADFQAETAGNYGAVESAAEAALATKGAKLDKKVATLAATVLPADTPSRDKEMHETEIATTALKKRQFEDIAASVDTIKAVAASAGAAASILEKICSEAGVSSMTTSELETQLTQQTIAINEEIEVTRDALDNADSAKAKKAAEGKLTELSQSSAKVGSMEAKLKALIAAKESPIEALFKFAGSELGEQLDAEKGATITDHEIFNAHARKWEKAYMDDMTALGVKDPDVLTRVTEYVPKIIDFVQKIVDKGLAYKGSSGSVYLDIDAFKTQGHHYRKLSPFTGETSAADMAEGEGELASEASEKKNPNDFALWKNSKPGEPAWDSPWGTGRPGWHIECSVVAGDILGANMDIHAGGSDLKFPHHDNELAQSEAYYGHHQWVNYFFHAGHLHIKGLKMSKSLKNFITIRQALQEHSARQLRLMFLMQPWDRPMNFSDQTVGAAKAKEAQFKNFFGTVKALIRSKWIEEEVGWRNKEADRALYDQIADCQSKVHHGMCENFNTPQVIDALSSLVTYCNNYIARPPPEAPAVYLLQKGAVYITQILKVVGVAEGSDEIGFPVSGAGSETEVEGPLDALTEFRDTVRSIARKKGSMEDIVGACDAVAEKAQTSAPAAARLSDQVVKVLSDFAATIRSSAGEGHLAVLDACDYVRDDALTEIGVRLEDATREGESSTWKLDDPETLKKEVAAKRAEAEARAKQAKVKQAAKLQKEVDKLTVGSADPFETLKPDLAKAKLSQVRLPFECQRKCSVVSCRVPLAIEEG
jgi:cysteinyl-tRNA synthetase